MSKEPLFLPSFRMDAHGNLYKSSCLNMNALENPMSREPEVLHLSPEDQKVFAEALLNPPPMNDAMKRAFERRKALMGEAPEAKGE